jgi:hypothetical protein
LQQVKEFLQLTLRKRELEEQIKEIDGRLNELQEQSLTLFEREGISSLRLDGHTVYLHRQVWASVDASNPYALAELKRNGLGDLVKPTVNGQTLSAWVRERQEEDKPIPPVLAQYLKISEKYGLRARKA